MFHSFQRLGGSRIHRHIALLAASIDLYPSLGCGFATVDLFASNRGECRLCDGGMVPLEEVSKSPCFRDGR